MAVIEGFSKGQVPSWLENLIGTPKGNLIEEILNQEFTSEAFRFFRLYAVSIKNGQPTELPEDKKELAFLAIEQINPRATYLKKQELDALIAIYEKNDAEAAAKQLAEKSASEKIKATKEKSYFARYAPDYKHWAMQPVWSISQAVALLLDIEPNTELSCAGSFSNVSVEKYMNSNKELITAKRYFNYYNTLYNIVLNSINRGDSRKPSFFIEWAKSKDIEVPKKLTEALKKFGHNATDSHGKSIEQAATIKTLEKELSEVKLANETLLKKPAKGIDSREHASLETLVLVMLAKHYKKAMLKDEPHSIGKVISDIANEMGVSISSKNIADKVTKVKNSKEWNVISKFFQES